MDSSALLELSRSVLEDARRSRADIAEMTDKARDDVKEMADKVRTDVKEVAKMAIAEKQAKATDAEKMTVIGEVTIVARTAPGWIVRLCVLVLILRWRPLFRLVGRLALMAAK